MPRLPITAGERPICVPHINYVTLEIWLKFHILQLPDIYNENDGSNSTYFQGYCDIVKKSYCRALRTVLSRGKGTASLVQTQNKTLCQRACTKSACMKSNTFWIESVQCQEETAPPGNTHRNWSIEYKFCKAGVFAAGARAWGGKGKWSNSRIVVTLGRLLQVHHVLWQFTHTAVCSWLTLSLWSDSWANVTAFFTRFSFSFSDFFLRYCLPTWRKTLEVPAGQNLFNLEAWTREISVGLRPSWVQLLLMGLSSLSPIYIHLLFPFPVDSLGLPNLIQHIFCGPHYLGTLQGREFLEI